MDFGVNNLFALMVLIRMPPAGSLVMKGADEPCQRIASWLGPFFFCLFVCQTNKRLPHPAQHKDGLFRVDAFEGNDKRLKRVFHLSGTA